MFRYANAAIRVFTILHAACLFVALAGLGVWRFILPRAASGSIESTIAHETILTFVAVAALCGLASMALRSGNAERIWLAISTVAAVMLSVLAL